MIADYYSRFPVIRKVHRATVSTTTKILKQVFSEYGVPQTVMTDNGPPFSSKEFAAFAMPNVPIKKIDLREIFSGDVLTDLALLILIVSLLQLLHQWH